MASVYDDTRDPLDYLPHWSDPRCAHGVALSQPCQSCSDELDAVLEDLRWGEPEEDGA